MEKGNKIQEEFIEHLWDVGNKGFMKIQLDNDSYLKFLTFYSKNIGINMRDVHHIFSQNERINNYKTRED